MTPGARIQAAIEILEGLNATAMPADRFIRDWFRTRRYAGSKDRAAVAECVFDIYRHRAAYAWRMQSETPRALAIASLLDEEGNLTALFDGGRFGPAALTDEERAAMANPPCEPPRHIRLEIPAFLEAELERSLGHSLEQEMLAMVARAPVDIRANTLKISRDELLARLAREGFAAKPTPYSPVGLRFPTRTGLAALGRHPLFDTGFFEFQDEASQIAVLLVGAGPGERILDAMAGAGGKTLALAAQMKNRGKLAIDDIDPARLQRIGPRAARAGVTIVDRADRAEVFDAVLVDAPCSGSGTWRRQPELKWRLAPDRLAELTATQDRALDAATGRVRPGGRIVYATCSLLASENEDRIDAFLERHPDFAVRPTDTVWHELTDAPPPGMGRFFCATPAATGTDGFFVAILVHKDGACAN